jgi:hypothetical protein
MALYPAPTSNTLRGTNRMGRHCSLSGGEPRYTTHLVASYRPGQEEDCSKDRYAGSPPEQEVISPSRTESCYISSSSGLCLPRVEVRCPLPSPEVTGITIQVSSPRYGATWYVSNRQIHEDLGVPLFADHIRALSESFNSRLADVGNPPVRQLGRYLS